MSLRRSLRTTSAARSMSERLVPWAIAATVPIEHGQITIPAVFADPDAGSAPRSVSSNTRTLVHSPPVACLSARSSVMPHSSVRSRQPWLEIMSQVGTWCSASTSSSRTPYGAPEAPVIAKITGRRFNALSGWGLDFASDGPADDAGRGRRERGEVPYGAPRACAAPERTSPFSPLPLSKRTSPLSLLPFSQDPIDQGAKEHDDADNPVGGKERRVEPRQVVRLHEPVLPGDEHGADRDPHVVRHAEPGAQPEQDEGQDREAVQPF